MNNVNTTPPAAGQDNDQAMSQGWQSNEQRAQSGDGGATMGAASATSNGTPLGVIGLVTEAWRRTMQDTTIVGWYLLFYLACLAFLVAVPGMAFYLAIEGMAPVAVTLPFGIVGLLVGFVLLFLATLALLQVVVRQDITTFGQGLRAGRQILWPFLILGLVTSLVMTGGFVLFFIPGIVMMGYLLLAQVVFVREEQRGIAALTRSSALVYGRWWGSVGRLFVLSLIITAVSLMVEVVGAIIGGLTTERLGGAFASVGSFLVQGFGTVFLLHGVYLWYEELAARDTMPAHRFRGWYIATMWIGAVAIVVLPLVGGYLALTNGANVMLPNDRMPAIEQLDDIEVNIDAAAGAV